MKYTEAELNIIIFDNTDVLTDSNKGEEIPL